MGYIRLGLVCVLSVYSLLSQADVTIEEGYVRGMPPGHPVTAAFMRLVNSGDKDVIIDSGSASVAKVVEFHTHINRDGKMSMQQMPSITVPAGGEFVLEPGKHHLMLIDLTQALREGDTVTVTLSSGNEAVVSAELPVRSVLNEHQHHHH